MSINDMISEFKEIEIKKEKFGAENICENCGKYIKGVDKKIICETGPTDFKYDPEKMVMESLGDDAKFFFCSGKCANIFFDDPSDFMRICRKCKEWYDSRLEVDFETGLIILSMSDLCPDCDVMV